MKTVAVINRGDVQKRAKALGFTSDIVGKINNCSIASVSRFYNDYKWHGLTMTRLKNWFEEVLQVKITDDR